MKTSLTTTLIRLQSQLPFSSSFESLFHQTNIQDSAVIQALAFSVAQNVSKWRQSVNKRSFSHGTVCTNKFKYLWRTPFLEKGPPKITEGGPFNPHWPISRINPGVSLSSAQASLCCREAEDRDKTKFEGDNGTFSLFPSSLFQLVIIKGYGVQVTTI